MHAEKRMRKILIVDDEGDIDILTRQRFRKEIKAGKYDFFFAQDGLQALEILENGLMVDVVVTDVNMPEMNGFELLLKMKSLYPEVKTIIVSAYSDDKSRQTAKSSGADFFLTKPLDFKVFQETLEALF
tara:strand:- start:143 stop:529 length:387 start_codon:yes stop_codon:yes gene_type:complete